MRHVLVTGAAGGIGAAIAARFAADGCRLTLTDYREAELAATAARWGAAHLAGDLADAAFAESIVDRAGELDVLVNAAGIYPATPLLEMTAHAWDRVQDVNVRAAMLTTVAFGRQCVASGRPGVVVNISSGAATRARPGAAHYATSKAALEMLTKACAVELGPHGVRVNAVSPGFVTVDSTANPVTEEYAAAVSVNPLGRRGLPGDIAEAVVWLASDRADWITGAVLRVDGGSTAGAPHLPRHWTGTTSVQEGTEGGRAAHD
ncbi:NAD(P)-dependent dehydrogenase, short-chain alcohol dehydrogenase family [Streptoalloteichus tenebrarius]|uniref:NAD(P)-dependent dehydrogenase, short-chain alcohol dehydrogenase family n=1 Tax=Streptoalloteichus tenebrarius (strain ATCC 17920 / DSM 40477 / JCM 4838 / CBS 697.72 / NBRC 16177 / NCIMB 11028 / NRRL B-12390 / A12253. 1 / ISP 5477) TaxID=1933 RepID=A0ABT1HZL8_STRSD|nr:SDR family oxidoreductase [Streptoalloteichus tenebrarius]MCP2260977.1 NAD(P)-dependent dehydrogenase, short-chain alcohol dehydrogenase family [Streptoalloteichus tenebrarius]BFE98915.1 SDR family oxidoreductase [Streptoalloteichus tenebrarius]